MIPLDLLVRERLATGGGSRRRFVRDVQNGATAGDRTMRDRTLRVSRLDVRTASEWTCGRWFRERDALVRRAGGFTPGDSVDRMLEPSAIWDAVGRFSESVIMAKEVAVIEKQALARVAPSRGNRRRRATDRSLSLIGLRFIFFEDVNGRHVAGGLLPPVRPYRNLRLCSVFIVLERT